MSTIFVRESPSGPEVPINVPEGLGIFAGFGAYALAPIVLPGTNDWQNMTPGPPGLFVGGSSVTPPAIALNPSTGELTVLISGQYLLIAMGQLGKASPIAEQVGFSVNNDMPVGSISLPFWCNTWSGAAVQGFATQRGVQLLAGYSVQLRFLDLGNAADPTTLQTLQMFALRAGPAI